MNTHNESATFHHWSDIHWNHIEDEVIKLQQRIYQAESTEDHRKVRDLQRIILNSKSALLLSIRRITQMEVLNLPHIGLSANNRMKLFEMMLKEKVVEYRSKNIQFIKSIEQKILAAKECVYQYMILLALEPQWEAKLEPTTYGPRPKRNEMDAIGRIFTTYACSNKRQWVVHFNLDKYIKDISCEFILERLGNFPAKTAVKRWLERFWRFEECKNHILYNLITNIALNGLSNDLQIKYKIADKHKEYYHNHTNYALCIHNHEFAIMCNSEEDVLNSVRILKKYIKERNIKLNADDVEVRNIFDGFDFSGYNIRKLKAANNTIKTIIRPSKESLAILVNKIRKIFIKCSGSNVSRLINEISPVLFDFSSRFSHVVSSRLFPKIDTYVWIKIKKFLKKLHPNKNWNWLYSHYFKPDKTHKHHDNWILTDPVTGRQIYKISWINIVRHALIRHNSSPYDKSLQDYFKTRDFHLFNRRNVSYRIKLANAQHYKCPVCGKVIDVNTSCETHHIIPKEKGGTNTYSNLQLLHSHCHAEYHSAFPIHKQQPSKEELSKFYRLHQM